MKKILNIFLPKERQIKALMEDLSLKCNEMSKDLEKFIDEYNKVERTERKSRASVFKGAKSQAEHIYKEAIILLENSKDPKKQILEQILESLAKLCKLINAIASRFVAMGIERIDAYTPKMSKLLMQTAHELQECIKNMKSYRETAKRCKKLLDMENEMDVLFEESLSELFHFFKNSMDVLKYKEIYELFENCADSIGKCAFLIERLEA